MPDDNELRQFFLNRRDWSSYLCALQAAANHPKVLEAVKSSRDWFKQRDWFTRDASEASNWLVGTTQELRDKFSAG
jgi:hypothetical protein